LTPPPIRVLVVDDSVVVRRVLARALEAAPDFEHVGGAADGASALAKIDRARPDLIVLDLEMPVMDGFETLRHLRARGIPTIVFSHLTAAGAAATLEALALGAVDFVLKPTTAAGIGLGEAYVEEEVLPRLRAVAGVREPAMTEPAPAARPVVTRSSSRSARVDAVVIAVSTGGPNALAELIEGLPPTLRVPVLIVQHMPAVFTAQLAERLDRIGPLPVREASDGEAVLGGHVYLAPGGRHLAVARAPDGGVRVALDDGPPENSCRPAGDVLFRSAADVYGAGVLALVMTGMGRDGLRGAEAIVAAGGTVLAQDSATSVVDGMPSAVAGIAAAAVPLPELAAEVARRVDR